MAYEPTVWKNGDVITAEKLNKLENGVGDSGDEESNVVTVLFTHDHKDDQNKGVYRYSVSFDQLLQAFRDGKVIRGLVTVPDGEYTITRPSVDVVRTNDGEGFTNGFEFVFLKHTNTGLIVFRIGIYETSSGTSTSYINVIKYDEMEN